MGTVTRHLVASLVRYPTTPPTADERGIPIPGSTASLERTRLGGVDQWVVLRGRDVRNPVLLFLAGGSELEWVCKYNAPLEDHYVSGHGANVEEADRFNTFMRTTALATTAGTGVVRAAHKASVTV